MLSSGLLIDYLLSLYLSEGMMIFTAVLLIAAVVLFFKGKGRRALRTGCTLVMIYCILYLGAVLALVILFGSNHGPAEPAPPAPAQTCLWVDTPYCGHISI